MNGFGESGGGKKKSMASKNNEQFVLAGDIGGTKTNLGLFTSGEQGPVAHTVTTYSSKEFGGLDEIIDVFLAQGDIPVNYGCFGVAGPVLDGQVKTTNLPWLMSEDSLQKRFGLKKVKLVNDLVATALSIPVLPGKDLYSLNSQKSLYGHNRALISPGTGLGMSLIPFVDGHYRPQPSEGGHIDFGPKNDEQVQLFRYLKKQYGHVSYERLVSGNGLVNIYSWLKQSGFSQEPEWLSSLMEKDDPAKVISKNAIGASDPQCEKALDVFISIFAAAAGSLALTSMATGGIYIGGGISPQILSKLAAGEFLKSFVDKGRYSGLLKKIPVKIITNRKAPLLGAAAQALSYVQSG